MLSTGSDTNIPEIDLIKYTHDILLIHFYDSSLD